MIGPGEYVPDVTEGITCIDDLPSPKVVRRSRNYPSRRCPRCGQRAGRCGLGRRTLHDLGDLLAGRPVELVVTYSKHKCPHCHRRFTANMSDLAVPKCHYRKRVQELAVRLVAEDGLPCRPRIWTRPWPASAATWPSTRSTTAPSACSAWLILTRQERSSARDRFGS